MEGGSERMDPERQHQRLTPAGNTKGGTKKAAPR